MNLYRLDETNSRLTYATEDEIRQGDSVYAKGADLPQYIYGVSFDFFRRETKGAQPIECSGPWQVYAQSTEASPYDLTSSEVSFTLSCVIELAKLVKVDLMPAYIRTIYDAIAEGGRGGRGPLAATPYRNLVFYAYVIHYLQCFPVLLSLLSDRDKDKLLSAKGCYAVSSRDDIFDCGPVTPIYCMSDANRDNVLQDIFFHPVTELPFWVSQFFTKVRLSDGSQSIAILTPTRHVRPLTRYQSRTYRF